ncbi:MAG: hypothetical protein ACO225_15080 [Ilumatobacteraceae bacterium]
MTFDDATIERSVTLHSTWRHVVGSFLGAGVVASAGSGAVAAVGSRPVPVVLAVAGWVALLAVAVDVPIATRFSERWVERRMLLRRQRSEWRADDRLTRVRPSVLRFERTLQHGGLVLRRGRRRYLLVDRSESAAEFDALVEVLESGPSPVVHLGASMLPRPSDRVPPTWLYRRRRWRPHPGVDR